MVNRPWAANRMLRPKDGRREDSCSICFAMIVEEVEIRLDLIRGLAETPVTRRRGLSQDRAKEQLSVRFPVPFIAFRFAADRSLFVGSPSRLAPGLGQGRGMTRCEWAEGPPIRSRLVFVRCIRSD